MHIDTVFTQVSRDIWVLFAPLAKRWRKSQKSEAIQALFGDELLPERAPLQVLQFLNKKDSQGDFSLNDRIRDLEDLLIDVSVHDFKCRPEEVQFIYSGDGVSPDGEREQWTDSCNVVAVKEGVVVGYDRNVETAKCFSRLGFHVLSVSLLISKLKSAWETDSSFSVESFLQEEVGDRALLLLDSAELSRARGGPHCMTMPLEREGLL
jgi:arginine deiminase